MGKIYFAQIKNNGPIKIGFTSRTPQERVQEIQTSLPYSLNLLGFMDGDMRTEKLLHERFWKSRIFHETSSTEWFKPDSNLVEYINTLLFE